MANLLITVMAILILSAASLVGLYYGGQAYMDMQAGSYANTIVTQATQIASAWQAWRRDHGGTNLTDIKWGDADGPSDLVAIYLNTFPSPPKNLSYFDGRPFYWPLKRSYGVGVGSNTSVYSGVADVDTIFLQFYGTNLSVSVCTKLAKLAGKESVLQITSSNYTVGMPTDPFGCFYYDNNYNGIFDAADLSMFYYKVF